MELDLLNYAINVAPAVAISVVVLTYLWKAYQDQINYQRSQDKANVETLQELSRVLGVFQNQTKLENAELRTAIQSNTKEVKGHIDLRIVELKHGRKD